MARGPRFLMILSSIVLVAAAGSSCKTSPTPAKSDTGSAAPSPEDSREPPARATRRPVVDAEPVAPEPPSRSARLEPIQRPLDTDEPVWRRPETRRARTAERLETRSATLARPRLAATEQPAAPAAPSENLERLVIDAEVLRRAMRQLPDRDRTRVLGGRRVSEVMVRSSGVREPIERDEPGDLFARPEIATAVFDDPGARSEILRDPDLQRALLESHPPFQRDVELAMQAQKTGDLTTAAGRYEAAETTAREFGVTSLEADLALERGRILQVDSKRSQGQAPERLEQQVAIYDRVIDIGTPAQQTRARNDLAVTQIAQRDYDAAVTTLRAIDIPADDPARSIYDYNLGRAYELSGDPDSATRYYLGSLRAKPRFEAAADGAYRTLLQTGEPRVDDAVLVADMLVSAGRRDLASRRLRECLEAWSGSDDAPRLCAGYVRVLAERAPDLESFRAEERPFLEEIGSGSALEPYVRDMQRAYEPGLAAEVNESGLHRLFLPWKRSSWGGDFANLLTSAATAFARAGAPDEALVRYMAAWELDSENSSPATYAASVLREHPGIFEEYPAVFAKLVEQMFDGKSRAYRSRDWENILRYHLLLASIFERHGDREQDGTIYTAVFQLEAAMNAERQVFDGDPDFSPSLGLYYRLGEAYRRDGRLQESLERYLAAGEGFLRARDIASLKQCLDRIARLQSLDVDLTQSDRARIRALEQAAR